MAFDPEAFIANKPEIKKDETQPSGEFDPEAFLSKTPEIKPEETIQPIAFDPEAFAEGKPQQTQDPSKPDSKLDQVLDIPRSLKAGAVDALQGMSIGADLIDIQVANKTGDFARRKLADIEASGVDVDSWKAKTFGFIANAADKILLAERSGVSKRVAIRQAIAESNEDLAKGMITDISKGVGGMWDLLPSAMSAGAFSLISSPARMFDEGYQDSIQSGKTEDDAMDTAMAYALMASPLEVVADHLIFKGKGSAAKRGILPVLKEVAKKAGFNFLSEGSTEVLQDGILNKLNGRKFFTPDSMRTFIVSGWVGLIGGTVQGTTDQVKIARSVKNLEGAGLTNQEAIDATNMLHKGNTKEATEFIASKNVELTSALEQTAVANDESFPLDEKQTARLSALTGKDRNGSEESEINSILVELDPSDQEAIYKHLDNPTDETASLEAERVIQKLNKQEAQDGDTERKQADGTITEGEATKVGDTGTEQATTDREQVASQATDQDQVTKLKGVDAPPSDAIGFSTAAINKAFVEAGQKELTEEAKKAHQDSMQNALDQGLNAKADDLASQVIDSEADKNKKTYQMSDEEVAGLGARFVELYGERGDLIQEQKDAMQSGDQERIDDVLYRKSLNIQKSTAIGTALKFSGTASGRANSMMASLLNRFTYDVVGITDAGRTAKGADLTVKEEADLVDVAERTQAQQTVVNNAKKGEKKKDLTRKIKDLTENVRFMKRNIEKRKGGKREGSSDANKLAELRRVERQQDTISDLLDVIRKKNVTAKDKKIISDSEGYIDTISNLRKEITSSAWYKDLQKESTKDAKKKAQLDALDEKLKVLKDQHEGKYRNIPESKRNKVEDADIKVLQDSILEISSIMRVDDQIADMQEQLRTGQFATEQKKVDLKESKELRDKKTLLHQLQKEAREKIYNLRTNTMRDKFKNWATLPRSLMATADMSYGLRQGLLPSFAHPKIAAETWGKAFKSFFSQNSADEIDLTLREDPIYDEVVSYGTHFSSLDSAIENRTEFFASNLAEKIPVFGKVVRASERNMVNGINLLRMGLMKNFLAKHPEASTEAKKAYAKYINIATGRGEAKLLDRAAEELSLAFFAPRFAVSRIQAPFVAAQNMAHPELRGEMVKQWSAYLGTGMTILAIAKAAGAEVGDDPEDSDWGKIIVGGNKRIDIWGGLQQPMRILAKAVKGGVQTYTQGETDINPVTDIARFLQYKLSPPVLMLNEMISGEDVIGRETEPIEVGGVEMPTEVSVFVKNMTPLIIQSAVEAYQEGEDPAVVAALAAGEGLGLSIGVYDK